MNLESIKKSIHQFPTSLAIILYFIYLGLDYYAFDTDPESDLNRKKKELAQMKSAYSEQQEQFKKMSEKSKEIENKKKEILNLTEALKKEKETLSHSFDIPQFMKMTLAEAKAKGISILSLKPNGTEDFESYTEYRFELHFQGVFYSLFAFLNQLAQVHPMIQVSAVEVHGGQSISSDSPHLQGLLELKAYQVRPESSIQGGILIQGRKLASEGTVGESVGLKDEKP